MSKDFSSLLDFSDHLFKASNHEVFALKECLDLAGKIIQLEAKKEIGYLQPQVGPFDAWEELADSTKEEKERLGYVFNSDYNPLFRTGSLLNSIVYEVNMDKLETIVGSKSQIAAFQEFGTNRIPPRPFIGPAMFKNMEKIAQLFGKATVIGIAGGNHIAEKIAKEIGYNQEIKL